MNFEKEFSEIYMSNSQIAHVMKKYIPEKLMNCVKLPPGYEEKELNAEEMVQAILSNSDNMLRMYGTARELLLDLKRFQNFPLSHRHFGFDPKEPYSTIPIAYRNMNGEAFMNKADVYCLLHKIIVKDLLESPKSDELFNSMKAILLKWYEERTQGVCEFCIHEEASWAQTQYIFSAIQELCTKNSNFMCQEWNYEKALNYFKALLPGWKQQEYCGFEKDLKAFFDSKSGNFKDVSLAIRTFAEFLKGFFSPSRTMHLPYDKETNPNCPIVVRVFKSHGVQFVMKSELFNAINIRNPDLKRLKCKEVDGKLMAMSYEEVQKEYKDRIGNIEFIKCPIQRTDHKAVPIMTPSGGHCILAADFLFEMLNELIFAEQIFRKIGTETWNALRRFFFQMTNFFSPHHKSIFFVTLEEQEKRKEELIVFWKQFENVPANNIRNVGEDGLTVQDLKDELANLGLLDTFPKIQDYAESVYSEVFKAKKEAFLRTCDLFKAVEKCLLNCIFKTFPNLQLFVHSQKACQRLSLINCKLCNVPNPATRVLEMAPEAAIPSPADVQKTPVPEKASRMETSSPDDIQKTLAAQKNTSNSEGVIQMTSHVEKESKNCEKCLRTSEMCNEAKKELRMTQNKLEKYEKKAKRTEDVEKELKALKLEMKRLKTFEEKAKRLEDVEKKLKERNLEQKQMRLEMKTLEGKMEQKTLELETKRKECEDLKKKLEEHEERFYGISNFTVTNHYQSERIEHILSQLEIEKQTTQSLEQQIHDFQKKDEFQMNQISENLRLMEGLQNEIQGLSLRNAELQKATPPITPSTSSEVESPSFYREELWKLQKIKDSFCQKKQVTVAKEMVERLKSSTNRQEIHQIADYELLQFQGKVYQYIEEVELNIQKIRDTRECSSVFPLPDYPAFSRRFLKIYWNSIDNPKLDVPESVVGEVADSECLICFFEMNSDQKTLKCEHCKKVTHQKCASKWLKIHRSCPHCRREQLDPEEFPNLS
ncbi:hypothetical protein B9Z55_009053 [Caenorhabditis nigoni]|uniref:RING-type domain-containing protein n=1 Tax=Caenorhabditis nigoni TaxID=1611254 RepID=A0A2G5UQH1_9PELO|nr:hypothetical protein B9Z55_009053 [Caenorhabditis nigoni]